MSKRGKVRALVQYLTQIYNTYTNTRCGRGDKCLGKTFLGENATGTVEGGWSEQHRLAVREGLSAEVSLDQRDL